MNKCESLGLLAIFLPESCQCCGSHMCLPLLSLFLFGHSSLQQSHSLSDGQSSLGSPSSSEPVRLGKEMAVPKLVEEFTVRAPLERVWQLLSNMERFGLCVPGCKEVKKVSETEYDWVIEARILRTSRVVIARTIVTEMNPPVSAAFRGEGELHERFARYKMTLSGTTKLQPVADGETKIRFTGDVDASGMGGFIINKIASGQMEGLLRDFEHNIKTELEK